MEDDNKHRFVVYELKDECADNRRCTISDEDIKKVKTCYQSVKFVNERVSWADWHAYLFEDIMVGCLTKAKLTRVVDFGPAGVSAEGEATWTPHTPEQLESLLKGAIPDRSDLQNRIATMCESEKI